MVPDNFFAAASSNSSMLQVVFVALLIGVGLVQLPETKARPLLDFFESASALVIRLVDLVMLIAPIGVFSLIASTITAVAGDDPARIAQLMGALGYYCIAVVVGLALQTLVTYPVLLKLFTPSSRSC
jgi:Na+/H+-dicarboxylate symporter